MESERVAPGNTAAELGCLLCCNVVRACERKPERSGPKKSSERERSGERASQKSEERERSAEREVAERERSGVKSAAHGPLKSHNHRHIDVSSSYFPKSKSIMV